MTDEEGQLKRDPIGFTAEMLGKAKTAANQSGAKLVADFDHIDELVEKLHGLDIHIGRIAFQDPVTQAAWMTHSRHEEGPPMMELEDEITRRRAIAQ